MSNKYLLFPLFGLVVPLVSYFSLIELESRTKLVVTDVGEVSEVEDLRNVMPKQRSEEIVFTGDVLLARHVEVLTLRHGTAYPFKAVAEIFSGAQTVIGNFESAILKNHRQTPAYVTTFSVDSKLVPLISAAGFTHMSLANNHSYDYGTETFDHTVATLTESNLVPFGHPHNSTSSVRTTSFISGDYEIGIVALNQIFTTLAWEDIVSTIADISKTTDYQIAYIHFGDEYMLKHNPLQEETAKKLIDAGIDAVVGHHPHVTQDIQVYKERPIFYSLGNFLFDQYFSVDVQQGLTLRFRLSSTSAQFTLVPVSSEGTLAQPHLMPESDRSLFLKNLARRSDSLYAENIGRGMIILPFELATYSQNSIMTP